MVELTELPTPLIAAIWGEEKSWKSTFGLEFPKQIFHMDVDVGGYKRAAWRIDTTGIVSESFIIPIAIEQFGVNSPGTAPSARLTKRVKGYRATWERMVISFVKACNDPAIRTIVIDSATATWTICHTAMLEEKQDIQVAKNPQTKPEEFRERLQGVEYPNDRMSQLIYTARGMGKNLLLTHYPTDVYATRPDKDGGMSEQKTGELKLDGFKHTPKIVDMVIRNQMVSKKSDVQGGKPRLVAESTIAKCGYEGLGTDAEGMVLPEPTYKGLVQVYQLMNGE